MANIIVATEEQIQEAVFNAVSKFFSGNQQAVFLNRKNRGSTHWGLPKTSK
jgi:hypothetical protein